MARSSHRRSFPKPRWRLSPDPRAVCLPPRGRQLAGRIFESGKHLPTLVLEAPSGFAACGAQALVTAAVEQDWGLYELIPEQQSLEDLFIELTHNEEANAG